MLVFDVKTSRSFASEKWGFSCSHQKHLPFLPACLPVLAVLRSASACCVSPRWSCLLCKLIDLSVWESRWRTGTICTLSPITHRLKKNVRLCLCAIDLLFADLPEISLMNSRVPLISHKHTHTHTVSHLKQQLGHLQTHYFILREKKNPKDSWIPPKKFQRRASWFMYFSEATHTFMLFSS